MSTATAGTADTGVDSVHQFSAKTSIDGNAVTVKAGKVGASAGYKDADFIQVGASRPLAAGSTLALTYTDKDDRSVVQVLQMLISKYLKSIFLLSSKSDLDKQLA